MVVRPGVGGAFGHVARLSSALARRGWEVAICGPHGDRADLDVEVIPVHIERSVTPAGDARAVRELGAIYRRWRPDLVHAHGSKGGIMARLARPARPRTPLVHTPHGYAFSLQVVSSRERRVYRVLEQATAPLATRVLAVCEFEARLARGLGLGRRARVVHNGIDPLPQAAPPPLVARLRERGPVVCVVSELHPRKGTMTFVEAAPRILDAVPDASIVWAGDGPDMESARRRVDALGIGERFHLPGRVEGVAGVLFGSDVYVSPSWAEAFPYSVLEAMGAARPIVATDVGGVGEAVQDGVTGRLVPARDPSALAEATVELLVDRARAEALGAAARRRVRERFTFDAMVAGTVAVYGELGLDAPGDLSSVAPRRMETA
jgi:glycosyltransferase involved in cell wall biosynthesis